MRCQTSPTITLGELLVLPKAHLHVHLETSIRTSLIRLWCEETGKTEPDLQPWNSLPSLLAEVAKVKATVPSPEALAEGARLFVHDEAADGIVWSEPQIHPYCLGTQAPPEAVIEAVLDGLHRGSRETGTQAGLIVTANYTQSPEEATRIARLAAAYADTGVVGLGLGNNETAAPASAFKAAFDLIADTPLLRVPHAGEACGPERIRDALTLRPHRIMHGVRAQEDPDLFQQLADTGITLDTAPSCNVAVGVIPDLEHFPVHAMLDAGVPFTVNADSTLMARTTATFELHRLTSVHRLSRNEVAKIAKTSIVASAAPRHLVDQYLTAIRNWAALA